LITTKVILQKFDTYILELLSAGDNSVHKTFISRVYPNMINDFLLNFVRIDKQINSFNEMGILAKLREFS
jgi:hypothetical protein